VGCGGSSLGTKQQKMSLSFDVIGSQHSNGDSLRMHAVVLAFGEGWTSC